MENEYSMLYDATFKEVFENAEADIKSKLIKGRGSYISFDETFDTIYEDINDKLNKLYIIAKAEIFKDVVGLYHKRHKKYLKGAVNLIFENQMKDEFKNLVDVRNGYNYDEFIKDFASSKALKEVGSIWYGSQIIYRLMYELNDFSDYRINKMYYGRPEGMDEFKKLVYKSTIKDKPDLYSSFEDYLEKEAKVNQSMNNFKLGNTNSVNSRITRPPKIKDKNFLLIENYKTSFENNAYNVLTAYEFINENETEFEDLINVFFKNWDKHKSRLYFDCSTEEASLFIFLLKKYFKNLTFASINRSELFYSADMNLLKEDNLSKSKNNAPKEDKKIIKTIIKKIFSFRSE